MMYNLGEWGERLPDTSEPIEIVYPAGRILTSAVPVSISRSIAEAQSCYGVGAYDASAMMCRKAVEALCAEHKAEGRDLYAKLQSLREREIVDGKLYDWAEALRLSGNFAAHDIENPVSQIDAKDLLEFCIAIIDYVYEFTAKYNQFMLRKLPF